MNEETLKGKLEQVKGNIQKQWGKLTDDDLDVIKGNTKELVGKLQERYGMSKEEAEKEAKKFNK